ncbi:MAG TPA: cupredoxin domain-containing protein [Thermoanaerobaculia bacterium]|jgi:cytochrome c oxidase subunit 2
MKRSLIVVLSLVIASMTAVGFHLYAQDAQPRVVTISAKRFEFTPNQITLKRGEPVTLRVSAEDRDHGFFQKDLKIALDLTPDHASEVTITPDRAGRFVAICDHFCGSGHGNMKMVINVE